jgi:hypothetical protein
MTQNPYRAPDDDFHAIGIKSGSREDLRAVAKYQKGILLCILFYLVAFGAQLFMPPELRLLLGVVAIGLSLTSTVFVFLLAMKVYSTGVGVVLGILTLVPCIGLIVLLAVNQRATGILKENGLQVGLLGADLSEI